MRLRFLLCVGKNARVRPLLSNKGKESRLVSVRSKVSCSIQWNRSMCPRVILLNLLAALFLASGMAVTTVAVPVDYNYLSEPCDPYYVGLDFPKLSTPQWIGEPGVEAVVILAIDDMRNPAAYEQYLRPIIDRIREHDRRSGMSIMTNQVDPADPQLQTWLGEGVTLDVHTLAHPCPCLARGNFDEAAATYHDCVDLLTQIPGYRPVAFRMPCCDSINSPSPRFWKEIFNRTSKQGNFLQADSSVFHLFTPADQSLPRHLTSDDAGQPRFAKYLPFPSFVNVIENYPYPYVLGKLCWQFPCMVPSDWEAQNLHQPNNPMTIADLQSALDATVLKQGVMNLVFHPHGWIHEEQIVQVINHASVRHGGKVRFLSFRDAVDRLNKNLLGGTALRDVRGQDQGVRLLDLNDDGYLDVAIGNGERRVTRIWQPDANRWTETEFPCLVIRKTEVGIRPTAHFGRLPNNIKQQRGSTPVVVSTSASPPQAWRFLAGAWSEAPACVRGLEIESADAVLLFRDLDKDDASEAIVQQGDSSRTYHWHVDQQTWQALPFGLPRGARLSASDDYDSGLRLVDVDQNGVEDILYSNEHGYGLHLWADWQQGWSQCVRSGTAGEDRAIPLIARQGKNFGAWIARSHLWIQNEYTDRLPDHVDRRSFEELLESTSDERAAATNPKSVGAARSEVSP